MVQLEALRYGVTLLDPDSPQIAEFDGFIQRVRDDMAARQDFLELLDRQVLATRPQGGWKPGDTGPMLQAGAWLTTTAIVSSAIAEQGKAEAAEVLRRPEVPRYFAEYLKTEEGKAKAGPFASAVVDKLTKLEEIASRDEIGREGARAMADIAGEPIPR